MLRQPTHYRNELSLEVVTRLQNSCGVQEEAGYYAGLSYAKRYCAGVSYGFTGGVAAGSFFKDFSISLFNDF